MFEVSLSNSLVSFPGQVAVTLQQEGQMKVQSSIKFSLKKLKYAGEGISSVITVHLRKIVIPSPCLRTNSQRAKSHENENKRKIAKISVLSDGESNIMSLPSWYSLCTQSRNTCIPEYLNT